MNFLRSLPSSPLAYFAVVPAAYAWVAGYSFVHIGVALVFGIGIFVPASYFDYRKNRMNAIERPIQDGEYQVLSDGLDPMTSDSEVAWPDFVEVSGRAPSESEIDQISRRNAGLALHDLPAELRELEFLSQMTRLSALWVKGNVNVNAISQLRSLSHLTLLSRGELDLSVFDRLSYYEGPLLGRESALHLELTELHVDASDIPIYRVPSSLEKISLEHANRIESLDFLLAAPEIEYLYVGGAHRLDVSSIARLKKVMSIEFRDIKVLTGLGAVRSLTRLRTIRLNRVRRLDDESVLRSLFGVDVEIL